MLSPSDFAFVVRQMSTLSPIQAKLRAQHRLTLVPRRSCTPEQEFSRRPVPKSSGLFLVPKRAR